jgi:hypothetical protein
VRVAVKVPYLNSTDTFRKTETGRLRNSWEDEDVLEKYFMRMGGRWRWLRLRDLRFSRQ